MNPTSHALNGNENMGALWRPKGASHVELFSGRLVDYAFSKHAHEDYTIGLNDHGLGAFIDHGRIRLASPGTVNLLNSGEVHGGRAMCEQGWTYRSLYIATSVFRQVIQDLEWPESGLPVFPEPIVVDRQIWTSMNNLFLVWCEPTSMLERDSALLKAVSDLVLRHADQRRRLSLAGPHPAMACRVRDFIEAHWAEEVSLEVLARIARASRFHLSRVFRKHFGLPPHAYQNQLRLQRVKHALRTSVPLAQIAVEHGFFDQSHLNRHFKGTFGVTPGAYRRAHLAD